MRWRRVSCRSRRLDWVDARGLHSSALPAVAGPAPLARSHGRHRWRGARRPIVDRAAHALPGRNAARRAGAVLSRAALAGQRHRGPLAPGTEGTTTECRRPARRRAGPALARRSPALCRAHPGRSGGDGGAATHAGSSRLHQCRAAALPARARRHRPGRAAHADGHVQPPAVVDRARQARLACGLGSAAAGGESAAADDGARQRPALQRRRLCPEAGRAGPWREPARRPGPGWAGGDPGRALPRHAAAGFCRRRGLGARRRRSARSAFAARPGRARTWGPCARCLRRAGRQDGASARAG